MYCECEKPMENVNERTNEWNPEIMNEWKNGTETFHHHHHLLGASFFIFHSILFVCVCVFFCCRLTDWKKTGWKDEIKFDEWKGHAMYFQQINEIIQVKVDGGWFFLVSCFFFCFFLFLFQFRSFVYL